MCTCCMFIFLVGIKNSLVSGALRCPAESGGVWQGLAESGGLADFLADFWRTSWRTLADSGGLLADWLADFGGLADWRTWQSTGGLDNHAQRAPNGAGAPLRGRLQLSCECKARSGQPTPWQRLP